MRLNDGLGLRSGVHTLLYSRRQTLSFQPVIPPIDSLECSQANQIVASLSLFGSQLQWPSH